MNGDNDSTILSEQTRGDPNMAPPSSFNLSQESQRLAESILEDATTTAGNTVMTVEEAASVGSRFVATEDFTKASKYGRLESNLGGSVISRFAALHHDKIYVDVTKETWTAALLSEEIGRLVTPEEVDTVSNLAFQLHLHRTGDVLGLFSGPHTMERWKDLRQSRQTVETLLWKQDVAVDMKRYLLKNHDDHLAEGVALHINSIVRVQTSDEAFEAPLEVARAAYGKISKYGPCQISTIMAGKLRDCQLDVDNPELFKVMPVKD